MVSTLLVVNAVVSFLARSDERPVSFLHYAFSCRSMRACYASRALQVVPARELVPGDIVRVRQGRHHRGGREAAHRTGERGPVSPQGESQETDKAPGTVLSSGSVVRRGEGNGVVTLTGAKTALGRTTELVQQARPKPTSMQSWPGLCKGSSSSSPCCFVWWSPWP